MIEHVPVDPEPAVEPKATNVIAALSRVMAEMPGIGRDDQASPAQGGYSYRGIEAITSAIQPLLAKHGVVFVPSVVDHRTEQLTVNGKPWTDTFLHVSYAVYGPGGVEDFIVVGPIVAIGRDNSDKGANKALTQAYKYALLQTLCISNGKDDGDQASHGADSRGHDDNDDGYVEYATPEAIAAIRELAKKLTPAQRAQMVDGTTVLGVTLVANEKVAATAEQADAVRATLLEAVALAEATESAGAEGVVGEDAPEVPAEATVQPEAATIAVGAPGAPEAAPTPETADSDAVTPLEVAALDRRRLITELGARGLETAGSVEALRDRLASALTAETTGGSP